MTPTVGPYRTVHTDDGTAVPFYILRFDKEGRCASPRTAAHALDALRTGEFSDVFVFSHGWNNDWEAATRRYDSFVDGFARTRANGYGVPVQRPFRPLLIGVFWPSTILVFPGERAPDIAGAPLAPAGVAGDLAPLIDAIAEALPDRDVERFYELVEPQGALDESEARELAALLAPLHAGGDEEWDDPVTTPSVDELLAAWHRLPSEGDEPPADPDDFGTVGGTVAAPGAAGGFSLDPRGFLRGTTVRMMKDRAGTVGRRGVAPLIRDVLAAGKARLHLVGHSYGCRVCLSAMAAGDLPRPVNSTLLLQPAVNHLCFADKISLTGKPGGYRVVLDRVEQPILTTYSRNDKPLVRYFHLALTRDVDLGEPQVAAWPEPPSLYAALGGYGPRSASGSARVAIKDPGQRYGLDQDGARIIAVDGSAHIASHSDISNEHTWWALYDQVAMDTPT